MLISPHRLLLPSVALFLFGTATPLAGQGGPPQVVRFVSGDGITVVGDLYRGAGGVDAPVLLLLHQSGSNATEYEPIAIRLVAWGYHCLAIDARGGGTQAFGGMNRTVMSLPAPGGGPEAYHDIKAALRYIRRAGFRGAIGIVGSSYSAGRMFQVLAEQPEGVMAGAAFSPGTAFAQPGDDGSASWAAKVQIPIFMSWAPEELDAERRARFAAIASTDKTLYLQQAGVHGASTLRRDRNPQGAGANFEALLAFLRRTLPTSIAR